MQKTVDRLLEHGWVEAVANPSHQRSSLIAITATGDQLQRTTRSRERALLSSAPAPVTAAELEQATATLARMRSFLATTDVAAAR